MKKFDALQKFVDNQRRTNYKSNGEAFTKEDKGFELVQLNIGGKLFTISKVCMKSIPNSLLSQLDTTSKHFDQNKQLYHFDRDAEYFSYILNAYREGELHMPRDVCPLRFRREMEFWKIPQGLLSPCCWKSFFDTDNDLQTLDIIVANQQKVKEKVEQRKRKTSTVGVVMTSYPTKEKTNAYEQAYPTKEKSHTGEKAPAWTCVSAWCDRVWLLLDEPASSTAAKAWCYVYVFVVLVSTASNIAWLYPGVRVQPYLPSLLDRALEPIVYYINQTRRVWTLEHADFTHHPNKVYRVMLTDPHKAVLGIDCSCMLFFVVESIVHFSVCPEKIRYFRNPYNLLRMILCAALVGAFALEVRKDLITNIEMAYCYMVFKSMSGLRLLLLFRLRKLYIGLQIICFAVEKSCKELSLLLFSLIIAVIIYGSLMLCMEIDTDMFPSMHTSMWWALITMTTVGYGDFYPTTGLGYVVGFVCALNGLIIVALPIAAIASNFANFYARTYDFQAHITAVEREKSSTDSMKM